MNRYIAFDTETGGTTLDTSLLTAYFVILDEKFGKVDDLYLRVKPDDGNYVVTAQGLATNRINLVEHDKIAIPLKSAKPLLYQFLKRNDQGTKLVPVGHGINFDLLRVKQDLISQGSWETFVSYHSLDTSNACEFLRAAGLFPDGVAGSLSSLAGYFNLPAEGGYHDAEIDTVQTVSVLKELLNLVKGK